MAIRSTLTAEYDSYTPIGTKLLIRKDADEKEIGGILLPDQVTRVGMIQAEVVAVGAKSEQFKVGDRIALHRQLSYNKIILRGAECHIIPEAAVLALIEA